MKTLIEGATAQLDIDLPKDDGTLEVISGYDVSAQWMAGSSVTPPVPACANVTTTKWVVLGATDGLGGRVVALRVTATDPVGGEVYIADHPYMIAK